MGLDERLLSCTANRGMVVAGQRARRSRGRKMEINGRFVIVVGSVGQQVSQLVLGLRFHHRQKILIAQQLLGHRNRLGMIVEQLEDLDLEAGV